ncbi:SgcJ/EcaC family oxidoreductase [Deinococcus lacus]|uniref:SgcJ/EcaC family oxidoreductase n=1 Tax=Deinococcus lacus TaxID=392561 RepID=A0ABW1Y998_9DEIO
MRNPILLAFASAALLSSCAPTLQANQPAPAPVQASSPACAPVTEAQVAGFFDRWNAALQTGDPATVASLYRADALLLPTVSNRPRANTDEIQAYFVDFLKKKPSGKIERRIVRLGCNVALDGGVYTFTFGKDGSQVTGRYTYVYEFEDGQWKIASHHSSAMPQDITAEPWAQ